MRKFKWKEIFDSSFWRGLFLIVAAVALYLVGNNLAVITSKLTWLMSLFEPFVWGFVFAFLLNGLMVFWERKTPIARLRLASSRRLWSVTLTFVTAIGALAVMAFFLVPQLVSSLVSLGGKIQDYGQNLQTSVAAWTSGSTPRLPSPTPQPAISDLVDWTVEGEPSVKPEAATVNFSLETGEVISRWVEYAENFVTMGVPAVFNFLSRVASSAFNAIIGLIIAVYLLYNKEKYLRQLHRVALAFWPAETVGRTVLILRYGNQTFTSFFYSKLLDSLAVGVICFVGMLLLDLPYALLVSVIIGVTNIIPFFGPFIGAIPSTLLILAVDPAKAVWFVLFVLVLQQFDGNVMGPKIMSNSVGLPAIWVMFAILIGGGMFGFVGMILGIPVFAMLYNLFREYVNAKLVEKSRY